VLLLFLFFYFLLLFFLFFLSFSFISSSLFSSFPLFLPRLRIASLVTFGTPHLGSEAADWFFKFQGNPEEVNPVREVLLDVVGLSKDVIKEITTVEMSKFNEQLRREEPEGKEGEYLFLSRSLLLSSFSLHLNTHSLYRKRKKGSLYPHSFLCSTWRGHFHSSSNHLEVYP
jgi:hypothetical protein